MIIGSLFPDLVDKTLLLLTITNGRSYFHTLLFVFLSFLALFLISKANLNISIPFLIGMLFHLALDLPHVPLFYPFISYDFSYRGDPLTQWSETLLTNPFYQTTEIIGASVLVLIAYKNRLFKIDNLVSFLKTNEVIFIEQGEEKKNIQYSLIQDQ